MEKRPPAERAVARAARNVAEGIDAEPECQGTLVSKAINREVGGERNISACRQEHAVAVKWACMTR